MAITSTQIDIGKFRSRVTFLNNTGITSLGAGGKVDGYVAFLTVWGQLRATTGNRLLESFEIVQVSSYNLIVRYLTGLENGLNAGTRVRIDSRIFSIESSTKVDELNFFYSFTLKQIDH